MECIRGSALISGQLQLIPTSTEMEASSRNLGAQSKTSFMEQRKFERMDSFLCSGILRVKRESKAHNTTMQLIHDIRVHGPAMVGSGIDKDKSVIPTNANYTVLSETNGGGAVGKKMSIHERERQSEEKDAQPFLSQVTSAQRLLTVDKYGEPADVLANTLQTENRGSWGLGLQNHVRATAATIEKLQRDTGETLSNQGTVDLNIKGMQVDKGLGIVEFLKNKRILVTGSTGFVAKVLVEKILRVQPEVGQLYLLINANTTDKAKERLVLEVQRSKLFQLIQRKYGKQFENFIQSKLTAVAGNVTKDSLGIQKEIAEDLINQIDIIVNSAATTVFDERYDVAVDINTRGPLRLLEFGKKCFHLQLFLHLSTAFVNGQRRGRVPEKPFKMGESIAKELSGDLAAPGVDVRTEIGVVEKALNDVKAQPIATQTTYMKRLGIQRAQLHGWQDTYVFTKAMGEMLIEENRAQLPVVILRPSVVESTLSEPFAGWMEGLRMMDPILIAYGKGQIDGFTADPQGVLDVVPADMVVNATLAAMAKHTRHPTSLEVYQIGSSIVNPLVFERIARLLYQHFKSQPFMDQKGEPIILPKLRLFKSKDSLHLYNFLKTEFPRQLAKFLPWLKGNISEKRLTYLNQASQQLRYLVDIYTPYTFYEGRFDISNLEKLYQELSNEEKELFGFEVRSIDWDEYIEHIHFPGLRKYPLNGRNVTTRY